MEALIPYAAQHGLYGLIALSVIYLLRDDLRAVIRRGPADTAKLIEAVEGMSAATTKLNEAVERQTDAVLAQSEQFSRNNGLFESVIAETRRVAAAVDSGALSVASAVHGVKEEVIRNGSNTCGNFERRT